MKVRCISEYPDDKQRSKLGASFYSQQTFHITKGKEYIILGLKFGVESTVQGSGVWLDMICDYGHLSSAPLCLFEIIDHRVSRFWECRELSDASVTLWPGSFYKEYYHDDLSEGVDEVVADFNKVRKMLESGFSIGSSDAVNE